MVKVEMPRVDWEIVTYILEKHNDNAAVLHIWNKMLDQIDSQEY